MAIVSSHRTANSDEHLVEASITGSCNECGRPANYVGFYGQHFCSEGCCRRFITRMHRGQDSHARAGYPTEDY